MTESGKVAIAVAVLGTAGTLGAKLLDTGGKSPAGAPLTVSATASVIAPVVAPASLAGAWTDKDGDELVIVQTGSDFAVTRWSFAGFVKADGSLADRAVQLDYRTDTANGKCKGELAADGRTVTLACAEPGNSYAQVLRRPG